MRTPKRLYAEERIMYQPELRTCLHCGDLLVPWNDLAWDKTVQTLDCLLSIATRPGHCPHATCPGSRMRLLSTPGVPVHNVAAALFRLEHSRTPADVQRIITCESGEALLARVRTEIA